MVLMLDVQRDSVQAREPDFWELSRRLRGLGLEMRSLSETQPDFSKRLESLQNELNLVACQLRRVNAM